LKKKEKVPLKSFIFIHSEQIKSNASKVNFKFSAQNLEKKDFGLFGGLSDPYLKLLQKTVDSKSDWLAFYKNDPIKKTLNPDWAAFEIGIDFVCNGDYNREIKIECYDWDEFGSHSLIGECITTLKQLIGMEKNCKVPLINPEVKEKKKKYENSGELIVNWVKVREEYTFLDFIWGGCEISLVVGIDFTSSNGNPTDRNSLHYRDGDTDNEYMKAIKAVGAILTYYDTDKLVPVYGFGARLKGSREVSHCFPLTDNPQNVEVLGVDGILDIYRKTLSSNIKLFGPTIFSELINTASDFARLHTTQQTQKYYILLIITDGIINDFEATKEALVRASGLPLSIVVVGVGNADFGNMVQLDSDFEVLLGGGKLAVRDILQFVQFSKYRDRHYSILAKETLAEIPDQLLSFMKLREFIPNPNLKKKNIHDE